ncbi:MAG: hypothetical protein JWO11_3026 [Nocardioides sp.]|nr:hypothetical protein [Nocardioides sp.]
MLKKLGVTAVAVAIGALAVGSVAPATGQRGHGGGGGDDDHGGGGAVIRVLSTNTEEAFIDVGDPGFSLGDEFVFTSNLTKQGRPMGHTGVVCTITSTATEESQCVGTLSLLRGEITIQGLVAGEPQVFEFPITGGSGAYEGAEGTLRVRELSSNPTRELLTIMLSD